MHYLEFERRIRKLNSRLYVDKNHLNSAFEGGACGVYEGDRFICGVSREMPEDTFFEESGRVRVRGWKSALALLVKGGHVDRRGAERLFRCSVVLS